MEYIFGFLGWWLAGLVFSLFKSFPTNPDPHWLRDGGSSSGGNMLFMVILHSLLWPYMLLKCQRPKDRPYGHWCGFLKYSHGHYADDRPVEISMEEWRKNR